MNDEHQTARINRNLTVGIILNTGFTIFEFAIGLLAGSLALISDAGHNLTDSLGLAISLAGNRIADKKADTSKTYGYGRATILAALINATLLLVLAAYIFYEAYGRIMHPHSVQGGLVAGVASLGIIANGVNAALLAKDLGDLNVRSAFMGMFTDVLASVGALIAGLVILFTGSTIADPLASLLIGAMLVYSTWGILRDALHILLEGVPVGIDPEKVKQLVTAEPLVSDVDDLHIWAISSGYSALSCHIVIDACDLTASTQLVARIKKQLKRQFKIQHATIETEMVKCDPAEATV